MTMKLIHHYFKHYKEDLLVKLVVKGNEIFAINKITNCKQIFINSEESILITNPKDLQKVKKYIYGN
jgi:cupin superfamily acireductone dioxygenase involved in methionine salvage